MDFFGINGSEALVILCVAVIVVGPTQAAQAIKKLRRLLAQLRLWSANAREKVAQESSSALPGKTAKDLVNQAKDLGIDVNQQAQKYLVPGASGSPKTADFLSDQIDPRQMIKQAVAEEMQAWLALASNGGSFSDVTAAKIEASPSNIDRNGKES